MIKNTFPFLRFPVIFLNKYLNIRYITDFLIHGVYLSQTYKETSSLWRPEADMQGYMGWMFLGQFLFAKFFAVLFARGYEGKGIMEGLRFGLLIGPFAISQYFIQYAVYPLTCPIVCSWVVLGLVQCVLAGVVAAAVYRQ